MRVGHRPSKREQSSHNVVNNRRQPATLKPGPMKLPHPILISFSGMDGAGKSTQIDHLKSVAEGHGFKVKVLTFWDDVVVLSRYREGFVKKVFKSEAGIGTPDKPVNRRDKNVRGWHVNLFRHGLYGLDALHLPMVINRAHREGADLIIMDRFIHDELANLPLHNPLTKTYIRAVTRYVPQPDIAFVLDADPEAARARKPEYPLDFLHQVRDAYLELANLLGTITVVPALSISEAKRVVELSFRRILQKRGIKSRGMWAA
jgi:thymidylate kinase